MYLLGLLAQSASPSPAKTAATHGSSLTGLLLPVILFGAVLLFIRANRRARLRSAQPTGGGPEVGREVLLRSGIFGTVTGRTDDVIFVEVAPGMILRVVAGAIGRVLPVPDSAEASEGGQPVFTEDAAPERPNPAEPDPAEPDPAEPDPAEPDPAEPDPAQPDPPAAPRPLEPPEDPADGRSNGTAPSP